MEFLLDIPTPVKDNLIAFVDAVRQTGPDQWMDQNSHRPMKGSLSHLHEARDKHGEMLYRLFLLWQRRERRVIFLDGRSKENETVISDREYGEIAHLSSLVSADASPFATADDFARLLLARS